MPSSSDPSRNVAPPPEAAQAWVEGFDLVIHSPRLATDLRVPVHQVAAAGRGVPSTAHWPNPPAIAVLGTDAEVADPAATLALVFRTPFALPAAGSLDAVDILLVPVGDVGPAVHQLAAAGVAVEPTLLSTTGPLAPAAAPALPPPPAPPPHPGGPGPEAWAPPGTVTAPTPIGAPSLPYGGPTPEAWPQPCAPTSAPGWTGATGAPEYAGWSGPPAGDRPSGRRPVRILAVAGGCIVLVILLLVGTVAALGSKHKDSPVPAAAETTTTGHRSETTTSTTAAPGGDTTPTTVAPALARSLPVSVLDTLVADTNATVPYGVTGAVKDPATTTANFKSFYGMSDPGFVSGFDIANPQDAIVIAVQQFTTPEKAQAFDKLSLAKDLLGLEDPIPLAPPVPGAHAYTCACGAIAMSFVRDNLRVHIITEPLVQGDTVAMVTNLAQALDNDLPKA